MVQAKNNIRLVLALLLLFTLTACSGGGGAPAQPAPPADTLTGELPEIIAALIAGANENLTEKLPQSFEDPVTAENCQGMLGLTPEQFSEYVTEAYVSNSALTTSAHEIALVKCLDQAAAAEVKNLIAQGFDSGKWVCVMPDESSVIDSGSYVLLLSTAAQYADALTASFTALAADNTGEKNVFYSGAP
ncbi:MAG: DUF4358 domain-containing protein [Gracilibacteraceae bacterium]|jgi:hypothetical protein|nr:DUF4358 domain-containing protein [Gracilibacteraceae bacterium]